MDDKLLPCPRCGSNQLSLSVVSSGYDFGHVDCQCGISFSFKRKDWESSGLEWYDYVESWKSETISAWNIRYNGVTNAT